LLLNKWDKLNAVGQLAAGIAHEIRNPLTTIKGFTQLWGQETHHQFSGIILSELERIEKIMNEFLILAKPHQETKFENKDVNGLLRETVVFMTPEAMLKNVKITTKFTNNLPLVYCEAEQLKQVVINLVKNAFDALPGGGTIRIETSMKDGFVSMRVVDHGVGIPRDRLPRLGEPFFSNKEKGTGLGLMVSFKIIENHNGNINIESEVGKGTTVEVLLPSVQK
ncbi:MAG TPA: ATP-binding protein, partial [Chondromyces sp.]|nr:ATP-binding protein [Chondromyces sp.]